MVNGVPTGEIALNSSGAADPRDGETGSCLAERRA
jgi:hypothetical protein